MAVSGKGGVDRYRWRRWIIRSLIGAVLFLILAELALRLGGLTDFPLYRRMPDGGYQIAPNQSGAFIRRNDWAFDDAGLGVAAPFRVSADGVLLVGDSIVYGGNPLKQADKLGPSLARATGRPVWPLAAGGWAFADELEALEAHPELLRLPTIVWIANSGDYGARSQWTNEIGMPTRRPVSALYYVFRRYVMKPHDVIDSPISAAAERRWQADLRWLLEHYHGRLIWVVYPRLSELGRPSDAFGPLLGMLRDRAEIVDVARSPRWRPALYRDGVIHPTAEGDRVLAGIIADRIARPAG